MAKLLHKIHLKIVRRVLLMLTTLGIVDSSATNTMGCGIKKTLETEILRQKKHIRSLQLCFERMRI
jgi:hypothetical protein